MLFFKNLNLTNLKLKFCKKFLHYHSTIQTKLNIFITQLNTNHFIIL